MRGDPEAPQLAATWFDSSWWETWIRASPEASGTVLRILAPDGEGEEGVSVLLSAIGAPVIQLRVDGATGGFSLGAHHQLTTGDDVEFVNNTLGPILRSPNGDRHRLKVANDGTLSTELVT